MKFTTETKNDVTVIRLEEARLDMHFASELKADLLVLAKIPQSKVLLDMKKVDYSDSSGLGAILFGIRQMRLSQGSLKLCNLQPRVLTLIKIAKLDNVIESFDNEEEALESFIAGLD